MFGDEQSASERLKAEGFEMVSSNGVQCLVCGCVVPNMPELKERHRKWHTRVEDALSGG